MSILFDLFFDGPVPVENGTDPRITHKQCIRSCFNLQLQRLNTHLGLRKLVDPRRPGHMSNQSLVPTPGMAAKVDHPNYRSAPPYLELSGQKYIPLFTRAQGYKCEVRFLILIPDMKKQVADTDNRVKVLQDALRIPQSESEVFCCPANTDPCFCVMDDDGPDVMVSKGVSRPRLQLSKMVDDLFVMATVKITRPNIIIADGLSATSP